MTKQPSATTNRNNTIALNDIDRNDALDGDIDSFDDGDNKALREQYAKTVGDKLRTVRKQMRMSLQRVEVLSDREFKASVLGAYERGERSISVPRLQRLAKLYDVPVDQLLPDLDADSRWQPIIRRSSMHYTPTNVPLANQEKVTLDLAKLNSSTGPEQDLLRRFLSVVQIQRQDFNGQMITIRGEDLRIVAAMFGVAPEVMIQRLGELDLIY
ncbi:MAG: transcriptional regulator [Actinobacteria bacterium]|jgi:transcriptional regulator with XRE-family HTH domain|nr:transcriptional regulator [Actinomycetota bacterium]MCL5885832.1 transcriptional regulator [Actinomycetota bacterium]